MKFFANIIKRRLLRSSIFLSIFIGVLSIILTFVIRNFEAFNMYFMIKGEKVPFIFEINKFLDNDTYYRAFNDQVRYFASMAFSFISYMHYGFSIYVFIINILIVVPVMLFYEEMKSGFSKFVLSRLKYQKYIIYEALAVSVSGWLIAFCSLFIFWLIAVIFSVETFPLTQEFSPGKYGRTICGNVDKLTLIRIR